MKIERKGIAMQSKFYHKNFNILVLGQIISLFGSSIQRFALSLYLLDLTGSAGLFATILALSMIPIVILSPIAGILADRGNKKKLMVILDLISGILLVGYLGIVLQGRDHVVVIAFVMILLSTLSTLYQPVVSTCIPILVEDAHLVKANAIIQQVTSLSNFLGPIFAGMLYGLFGITGVILLNMISFLFSAIMELFLELPHAKGKTKVSLAHVFVTDMKESYQYLRYKNPIVLRMLVFSGFYNLFLVPVFSIAAPYLIKVTFGLSAEVYGIAEGMIALGMIMGGMIITCKPDRFHIKRVHRLLYMTSFAMFMMGTAVWLFQLGKGSAFLSVTIFTLFGMLIMGILGIANVLSAAYLYHEVEGSMLGKILAFGSAFATLCIPLGQILFGKLIENFVGHIQWIIWLAALFVLGVTILVRWNVLQIKEA